MTDLGRERRGDPGDRTLQGIRALIVQAQSGDGAALARLIEIHEPMMLRWARRRLGQPLRTLDETRDVLHDAYQVARIHRAAPVMTAWVGRRIPTRNPRDSTSGKHSSIRWRVTEFNALALSRVETFLNGV